MEASSSGILLNSEIFYNFAVGVGAIGGGIFVAVKAVIASLNEYRKRHLISKLRKQYSRSQIDKTFKIVDTDKHHGHIYILDLVKNEKRWIMSYSTYRDLGFASVDRTRIPQEELDKYSEGEGILTSGLPGT